MYNYSKFIIVENPHGEQIISGKKKFIITENNYNDIKILLIQNNYALGYIKLKYLKKITHDKINKYTEYNTYISKQNLLDLHLYRIEKGIKFDKYQLIYNNNNNIQFIFIGTSGYYKELYNYSKMFTSVELNVTFYKNLSINMVNHFEKNTYSNFIFSVKMNRMYTHYKRLNNIDSSLDKFIDIIKYFKKAKVFLFQFHPSFVYNNDNFNKIINLKKLKKKKLVFEFRNNAWYNNRVFSFMKKYRWSISIIYINNVNNWCGNLNNGFNPSFDKWKNTNDILYIRLHGYENKYIGSHKSIFNIIFSNIKNLNVKYNFIYFNNTDSTTNKMTSALYDANKLIQYINNLNYNI